MEKRGFEFSFNWIFALIAGAAILFIAIYASGKFLNTGEFQQSTETAKKLTTLFEPLGVQGLGEARTGKISLQSDIKIYSDCFTDGSLGRQRISIAEKKSFNDKEYGDKGVGIEFSNKYIFFTEESEGREFDYFTKSLNLPFKTANLLVITDKNYCFVKPPRFVEDEINDLGMKNIIIKETVGDCIKNMTMINKSQVVCFDTGSTNTCGSMVTDTSGAGEEKYSRGYVNSPSGTKYFVKELLYPAIFSKKTDYECNVKRIMMRTSNLAKLYTEKSKLLSIRGVCESGQETALLTLDTAARTLRTSQDLSGVKSIADGINQNGICELWN
ncbi:MAG: hypothetical protein AABW73_02945 [Nanoarchaeota archaeon]